MRTQDVVKYLELWAAVVESSGLAHQADRVWYAIRRQENNFKQRDGYILKEKAFNNSYANTNYIWDGKRDTKSEVIDRLSENQSQNRSSAFTPRIDAANLIQHILRFTRGIKFILELASSKILAAKFVSHLFNYEISKFENFYILAEKFVSHLFNYIHFIEVSFVSN